MVQWLIHINIKRPSFVFIGKVIPYLIKAGHDQGSLVIRASNRICGVGVLASDMQP
jgi:hypothetical protein